MLSELARSNTKQNSIVSKNHYDVGKRDAGCKAGHTVLLRKELRAALDCRYEAHTPYYVGVARMLSSASGEGQVGPSQPM